MHQITQKLHTLIEPMLNTMGYELVGVEYHAHSGNGILRVYIDHQDGIKLDDCQAVSHQISGLLDVEDPIVGNYTLEVSSPGLDRPLFDRKHYEAFTGHKVRISLNVPVAGRRKFTGLLKKAQGSEVVVEIDSTDYSIPLANIAQARLVPEL